MKKVVILIFVIFCGNVFKAFPILRNGIYSCKINESGCTLELRVGENGHYNLIIIQKMHVSVLIPLSIGNFIQIKDTIYLRDSSASTTFLAVIKKKQICFVTGYPILQSKKLKFEKPNFHNVNFLNFYVYPDTICNFEPIKEIILGFYKSIGGCSYHFKDDGTFAVYCNFCAWGDPFEITNGKFIQNNCIIYLYDNFVNKIYRMRVKELELINIDIPYNPGPYFPFSN